MRVLTKIYLVLLPCHPDGSLTCTPFLQWFSVFHRDALGGAIAQVVALLEECLTFAFDALLGRHLVGHCGRESMATG
jgi:hypothetical protein